MYTVIHPECAPGGLFDDQVGSEVARNVAAKGMGRVNSLLSGGGPPGDGGNGGDVGRAKSTRDGSTVYSTSDGR